MDRIQERPEDEVGVEVTQLVTEELRPEQGGGEEGVVGKGSPSPGAIKIRESSAERRAGGARIQADSHMSFPATSMSPLPASLTTFRNPHSAPH